jgi:hypothetical protein
MFHRHVERIIGVRNTNLLDIPVSVYLRGLSMVLVYTSFGLVGENFGPFFVMLAVGWDDFFVCLAGWMWCFHRLVV